MLATIVRALRKAGVEQFEIRCGDLGLFNALIDQVEMPARWRARLKSQFWRPEAFRSELQHLVTRPAAMTDGLPEDLLKDIDPANKATSERAVERYLAENNVELIGARSLPEIAANLMAAVEDGAAPPLSAKVAELIESYLGVAAPARAAGARLRDLMSGAGIDISAALDVYSRRLQRFAEAGAKSGGLEHHANGLEPLLD